MSEFIVRESTQPRIEAPVSPLVQWLPVLLGPMLVLVVQEVMYLFVDWSCYERVAWPIHLSAGAAVAITLGLALLAHRTRASVGEARADEHRAARRTRFMGAVGILSALLSLFTIVAMWIPVLVLSPCHQSG